MGGCDPRARVKVLEKRKTPVACAGGSKQDSLFALPIALELYKLSYTKRFANSWSQSTTICKNSLRGIIKYDIAVCVGLAYTPDKKRGIFALIRHKKEDKATKKEVIIGHTNNNNNFIK